MCNCSEIPPSYTIYMDLFGLETTLSLIILQVAFESRNLKFKDLKSMQIRIKFKFIQITQKSQNIVQNKNDGF